MIDKDLKRKYLFVDGIQMERRLQKDKEKLSFNNPIVTEVETLNTVFEKNGIPEKYRIIIIQMNIPHFGPEAEEYLTKIDFDVTGHTKFKKTDNPKMICGRAFLNGFCDYAEFNTPMEYKTYDEVMKFYKELKDMELLESYINSIQQFFSRVSMKENLSEKIYTYYLTKKPHSN